MNEQVTDTITNSIQNFNGLLIGILAIIILYFLLRNIKKK